MKNLILLALAAVIVSSCGVVAADLAMISCTAPTRTTVKVSVDNQNYNVKTSKTSSKKAAKKAAKMASAQTSQPAQQPQVAQQPQGNQQPQTAQQPQTTQNNSKTTTNRTSSTSRNTQASSQTDNSSSRRTKTISVDPGEHDVQVTDKEGNELYKEKVELSASEHKVIDLKN